MHALTKMSKSIDLQSAEYSPDRKLIAYCVKPKDAQQCEIRIVDAKGNSRLLAHGAAPHWMSPKTIWKSNGLDPRNDPAAWNMDSD